MFGILLQQYTNEILALYESFKDARIHKLNDLKKKPNNTTQTLTASVGHKGVNHEFDVKLIQNLLNTKNNSKLIVDGIAGNKTKTAIAVFQRDIVQMPKPDGRVDVNMQTWKALTGSHIPTPIPNDNVLPTPEIPKPIDNKNLWENMKDLWNSSTQKLYELYESIHKGLFKYEISQSVGKNASNIPEDVLIIRTLLINKKILSAIPFSENFTKADNDFCNTIEKYQRTVMKMSNPDGRIDPNGATWKALMNHKAIPQITPSIAEENNNIVKPNNTAVTPSNVQLIKVKSTHPNAAIFEEIYNKGFTEISDSVGLNGKNNPQDVLKINALLYKRKMFTDDFENTIATLDKISDNTIEKIKRFQKNIIGMKNPDGKVDKNGNTLRWLNGQALHPITEFPKLPNPQRADTLTKVNGPNEIIREGLWSTVPNSSRITATPEDIKFIMDKMRQPDSPIHWKSIKTHQTGIPSNIYDQEMKDKNLPGLIRGKSLVVRPKNGDHKTYNALYGYIDHSKLPAHDKLGHPGRETFIKNHITWINVPFIKASIPVNKKVADSLGTALNEVYHFYGLELIQKLGIDMYGGCFAFRHIRNRPGSASPHAYGCAIDLAWEMNGLGSEWNNEASLFHQQPYAPLIDIMEKYGWYNQGRYSKNDYMHFQTMVYINEK